MVYCEVLLSTSSTRGRELKKYSFITVFTGTCRPPREVVSWKVVDTSILIPNIVDLHERSWVEKVTIWEFPQDHKVDLHERSWVEKTCGDGEMFDDLVDLHERSWVEKNVLLLHNHSPKSTSTRGRELKMYYKMRVLKRILQTFLSYIHLSLRYTYRSWKTIKQK